MVVGFIRENTIEGEVYIAVGLFRKVTIVLLDAVVEERVVFFGIKDEKLLIGNLQNNSETMK